LSNTKLTYDLIPPTIAAAESIVWLRRDLRLHDSAALYYALRDNKSVLPIFIFDINIIDQLDDEADARVHFIHESLSLLKSELEKEGSSLMVFHGDPVGIFKIIAPKKIYANHDYEPYAITRDKAVGEISGITLLTFKDQVIFDKNEITKDDGTPYTVFTPYSRKWKSKLDKFYSNSYPTEKYFPKLLKTKPIDLPSLESIGFSRSRISFPPRLIKREIVAKYKQQRDFPAIDGTSRLSVHLRFGTVSIRDVVRLALKKSETWLNELIWREFYQMILWHFPHVEHNSFKTGYDRIQWLNNPEQFDKWCKGQTGYPIVDAGMRELAATGFMHNRVRMITAGFLAKHLLIDWRWGEAWFASKLLDFDLASNNGGWQWAAGTGSDAAPYFRVFNPSTQAKNFDPDNVYIKKWVPELGTDKYPEPIVEHAFARNRAMQAYRKALG
jgi:deoxyribodipyrimidine photo-lyase